MLQEKSYPQGDHILADDPIKFLTKAKNYYFDQLAKYLPKIEIYW